MTKTLCSRLTCFSQEAPTLSPTRPAPWTLRWAPGERPCNGVSRGKGAWAGGASPGSPWSLTSMAGHTLFPHFLTCLGLSWASGWPRLSPAAARPRGPPRLEPWNGASGGGLLSALLWLSVALHRAVGPSTGGQWDPLRPQQEAQSSAALCQACEPGLLMEGLSDHVSSPCW